MNKEHHQESILHSNNGYLYHEEIIGEYIMELPVFDNKKLNSAPNQQRKKKVLKPIRIHTLSATRRRQCTSNTPYQTTYTSRGTHSYKPNINQLLNNDHTLKIKQLENELVEVHTKIQGLITENRLLKTLEKRQENALSMYEGKKAKLPQIIKSYEEDLRMLQSQLRQMKISYKEMENRYKSQSNELLSLQKQHTHLLSLSKNKELSKSEKLYNELEDAKNTIRQQDKKIQNFMKQLELQNKTHRHHIQLENNKIKELQLEVNRLKTENQNRGIQLNGLKTIKTKSYSARQIFTRGITENSINITPRVVKPTPTTHEQGDEIDESFYKTNGSISLKPESLHAEHEDTNPNESLEMDLIRQMKRNTINNSSKLVNQKSFSSSMSNNLSWLNQDLAKLKKFQENKPELPIIENTNFEKRNEKTTVTSHSTQEFSMSRTQKDLLLAKLNQVCEDKNNYENYNPKSFKHSVDKINSLLVSNYISSQSSSSSG